MTHQNRPDGQKNASGRRRPSGAVAEGRTALALAVLALALGAATPAGAQAPSPSPSPSATQAQPQPQPQPRPILKARPRPRQAAAPAAKPASAPADPSLDATDGKPPVHNSDLNAPLMYQLLLGELARQESQPADAVELMLDAAHHEKSDQLFRRAIEIAVESGATDKALDIAKAWRKAMPRSTEAVRTQLQLLFALDRAPETTEPLRALLAMSPGPERAGLIAGLPRIALRAHDKAAAATQLQSLLTPYLEEADTRVAARVALGRLRLAEGHPDQALAYARDAHALEPAAIGPALLALDLMAQPGAMPASGQQGDQTAEAIVRHYLDQPGSEPIVRQALAALLTSQQRIGEAAAQLKLAAEAQPTRAMLWLSLGELDIELRQPDAADAALQRALDLTLAAEKADKEAGAGGADEADGDDDAAPSKADPMNAPVKASRVYLMLARSAQLRHDDAATARWLAKIPLVDADLAVLSMRADVLARAGKLAEARALVQSAPADTPEARRLKVLTEVQLLREHKQLAQAQQVLAQANTAEPNDVDLLYEQAMIDERLDRLDEMEKLLRQVIALQPDHAQAMNALGYSLADRRLRLDEALALVKRAHELAPADPFIVDSLGWIEFRLGHYGEATRWLRQAYTARNDTEIAAHLGEALWAQGEHDEALRILKEAQRRDADNQVLRETLARLQK